MLKQEPLPTHDGRAGNRGAIVNIASQLGIVSTYSAREFWIDGGIGEGGVLMRYSCVLCGESGSHFDDEERCYRCEFLPARRRVRTKKMQYSKENIRINCVCPGIIE